MLYTTLYFRKQALVYIALHNTALSCELLSITIVTLMSEPFDMETNQKSDEQGGVGGVKIEKFGDHERGKQKQEQKGGVGKGGRGAGGVKGGAGAGGEGGGGEG